MLARLLRRWSPSLLHPLVRLARWAGITANQVTLAGLLLAVAAGLLIALGLPVAAGIVLLLSGVLDALDGELARQSAGATPLGGFLDSVADHYGDLAVYLGIFWVALEAGDRLTLLLVLLAMFGSLVGSHIRSRAGALGLGLKDVGFFTRAARIIVFPVGLLTGLLTPAVAILALAHNLSALQLLGYVTLRG